MAEKIERRGINKLGEMYPGRTCANCGWVPTLEKYKPPNCLWFVVPEGSCSNYKPFEQYDPKQAER